MSDRSKTSVTDGNITKDLMECSHKLDAYESTGTDSGFLSGSITTSDYDIQTQSSSYSVQDSGVIEDKDNSTPRTGDNDLKQELILDDEDTHMRFDSGVDVGLSETFSGLSLESGQHLNDLSGSTCLKQKTDSGKENSKNSTETTSSGHLEYYFQQDNDGDTPLHLGIIHGFTEAVYSLVRLATNPQLLDIRNDICQSPLHLAVLTGQPLIVRLLVVAGARQSVRDRFGETALHLACQKGDLSCVRALSAPVTVSEVQAASLKYNFMNHERIDSELWNYEGETCVHVAALQGHIDILRHLVWLGANINAREGKSGYTALHFAIVRDDQKLLQFLLGECRDKLNLETQAYNRLTAYQITNDLALKKLLTSYGAIAIETDSESSSTEDESDSESEMSYSSQYTKKHQIGANVAINASA